MTQSDHKALIAFDGVCLLCLWSVHFVLKRDHKDHFRFVPLEQVQQHPQWAKHMPFEPTDSIVLISSGKTYTKSSAALRICLHLGGLYPILFIFMVIPKGLRDLVYDFIAKNRYRWFGKKDQCMIPDNNIKHKFL